MGNTGNKQGEYSEIRTTPSKPFTIFSSTLTTIASEVPNSEFISGVLVNSRELLFTANLQSSHSESKNISGE